MALDIPSPDAGSMRLPTATLACGSRVIAYTARVSARARYLGLTIRPETGLVVTIPARMSPAAVTPFLHRHAQWIARHLDRLEALAAAIPKPWPYGATLPYLGRAHRVLVHSTPGMPGVERQPSEALLIVRLRQPGIEGARRLLKRWYVAEASRWLRERATSLGAALGIAWRRLAVRDQRRRWGSCSARGHLSFNYRLIMAPASVAEYVVLHELLHRRQLNHSPRFWALVHASCPAYRQAVTWLRAYGPYLGV